MLISSQRFGKFASAVVGTAIENNMFYKLIESETTNLWVWYHSIYLHSKKIIIIGEIGKNRDF